jgi:hypothetical protein
VSLSGGQKARFVKFCCPCDVLVLIVGHGRVALARAVYARTKYVLLDDPLSAVVSFPCTLTFY